MRPYGVSWRELLGVGLGALLSMAMGSAAVHTYYRPLEGVEEEARARARRVLQERGVTG